VRTRSTIEVLDEHLEPHELRDLEGDLEHNYAQDVVLLCEHGALKGRDAVRDSAKALADQLPRAEFQFPFKQSMANTLCCIGVPDQQMWVSILVWIRSSFATVVSFYKPFLSN
jgi:hypothetical protein